MSREIHGIAEETLRGYLIRMGGQVAQTEFTEPGGEIRGAGWTARLTRLPDYRLGQAVFCAYQVEIEGEDEAVKEAWKKFELRVMRPGG